MPPTYSATPGRASSRTAVTSSPSPIAEQPAGGHLQRPERGVALAAPSASGAPQTSSARSGMNMIGIHPSATSAVIATLRSPSDATHTGIDGPHGVRDDLERLAEPGALAARERQVVVAAVVLERCLTAPHVAADLDDLARPAERRGVGDAVEPLDHLWARRAEAEVEPPVAQRVDACGGHREERRGARVDGEDRRADLDALGERGEVAHEARAVEAVGLGHPHEVEPRRLHLDDLAGGGLKPPE